MRTCLAALVLVLTCTACEQRADGRTGAAEEALAAAPTYVQPAGTVVVNFSVDDRENRVYGDLGLKWKGGFFVDRFTRLLVRDDSWSGGVDLYGFPALFDDGPWTTGGHEPAGAKPGDHVLGMVAFAYPPAAGEDAFGYGLIDVMYERSYGNGWIWSGPNGTLVIPAGATGELVAPGVRLQKFGKQDLRLVLDTKALVDRGWPWDLSFVGVKSGTWGWGVAGMEDLGDGVFALELGTLLDAGLLPHTGLLRQGTESEFAFVLGWEDYAGWQRDDDAGWFWAPFGEGVSAATRCKRLDRWVPAPVGRAWNANTSVIAPSACAE